MSSPSRQVIDPLICAFSDNPERRPSSALSATGNNVLFSSSKPFSNQYTSYHPAGQNASNPSASWTPLVSHTFSTEMGSLNSTPSSKLFSSLYRQNDADFAGLNLTPFLTHNINLMPTSAGAGASAGGASFTPFYDKSMHMADFFMDSPIRASPRKMDGLTPSKFALSDELKDAKHPGEGRLNPSLSVVKASSPRQPKRSITQLDTPARHQAKKSDRSIDLMPQEPQSAYDSDTENANVPLSSKYDTFATPSKKKVLRDTSAAVLNKTPLAPKTQQSSSSFLTPAAKCPVSSPSTVIMSSAVKSPAATGDAKVAQPPTPTPHKSHGTAPKMGIFSENKVAYTQPAVAAQDPGARKKAPKRPGTNKFQIVFTDMHTLMNSKSKPVGPGGSGSKKLERKKGKAKAKGLNSGLNSGLASAPMPDPSVLSGQYLDTHSSNNVDGASQHGSYAFSNQPFATSSFTSQEINTSMASSKEYSMNTTAANMSTMEHASFEGMHGSFSTPNKFILDNSFEKHSPLNHSSRPGPAKGDETPASATIMPPPAKAFTLQQAAQLALRQDSFSSHGPSGQALASSQFHNSLHPHSQHHSQGHVQNQMQGQIQGHDNPHQQMFMQHGHGLPHGTQHYVQPPPNMAMTMSMSTPQHERVFSVGLPAYPSDDQSPSEKASSRDVYPQMRQFQPAASPSTFQSHGVQTEGATRRNTARAGGATETSPRAPVATDATNTKKTAKRRPRKR